MKDTNRPENAEISNPNSSIELLQKCAELVFANVFNVSASQFQPLSEIIGDKKAELEGAIAELDTRKAELSLSVKADCEFIIGRHHYDSDRLETAIESYAKSLSTLQNKAKSELPEDNSTLNNLLQKQGAVLYHLGLCYCDLAGASSEEKKESYWQAANNNFQECLEKFELGEAQKLVSKFISKQAEVLLHLEAYEELQEIAEKALDLHINYGSQDQLARDYGFLAEAAMHRSKWAHAIYLVELALAIQNQSIGDRWEMGREDNSYLALLAESREQLEQWQKTVERLEMARQKIDPARHLDTYLQILKALQKLYFEQDKYGKAAEIQETKLKVEHQYRLRAFIGASQLPTPQQSTINSVVAREIEASDRLQDVNNLLARIKSDRHKLTVIYGKSGAGKSSLINAGLLPMLLQPGAIDDLAILPIILRVYTDWLREPDPTTWHLESVLENLRKNDGHNQLKVLIFDQFEEFFAVCTKVEERLPFYEFLRDCLSLGSVKVILSMRTDCLHYLLEGDRLTNLEEIINYEILSKEVLYYLGNFSPTNAKKLIQSLTETTSLDFETALIDKAVKDVTVECQEVRPIELQLVGAELQSQGITTLEKYRQLGDNPKDKLMEAFLDRIVKECGFQKERLAILVLYSLTEKNSPRPLKTRAQIAKYLSRETNKIDKILEVLEVLVAEGLVLLIPDMSEDRYQLAHDYLVHIIREQKGEKLIAELELELDKIIEDLRKKRPNNLIYPAISYIVRWMRED